MTSAYHQALFRIAKEVGELIKSPPDGITVLPTEKLTEINATIAGPGFFNCHFFALNQV